VVVENSFSIVEKNVFKTERFFDNHYKEQPFFFAVAGICHLRVRGGAKKITIKAFYEDTWLPGEGFYY
jgi:3-hydroxymyristoyl/3-hydroxydecanoyl-(acyl carrier protein) dehydratase